MMGPGDQRQSSDQWTQQFENESHIRPGATRPLLPLSCRAGYPI